MEFLVGPMVQLAGIAVCMSTSAYRRVSTYKVLLQLVQLLLVALQSGAVHGSALDRDLTHLQVHLLHLQPNQTNHCINNLGSCLSTLSYNGGNLHHTGPYCRASL